MIRFKIFKNSSLHRLENDINDFLINNEIVDMKTNSFEFDYVITLLYRRLD